MAVIPSRQDHSPGKCLFKPRDTLFHCLPFPGIPGLLICKFAFLAILNLYNVQKIIGVPDHVLTECTAVFRFLIDYLPCLFYVAKRHELPHLRCQHIHTERPQNRSGTAQGDCLTEHGIGCRLIFLKGVIFPAITGAGKATGEKIAGIPIVFLCRKQ
jgi:hypothetical protein